MQVEAAGFYQVDEDADADRQAEKSEGVKPK
jgi:hypothetical protein